MTKWPKIWYYHSFTVLPDQKGKETKTNMRFRFCGDLDCPDWVLAEITTLSKLTSVKMKLLCVQVVKDLLGEKIDYEKVHKLTSDAKFEVGDIKGTIAALNFILSSSAKYNVDNEAIDSELQQLGLPKEHSTAICKAYGDNSKKLQQRFKEQSLRLSHLESVDWRVDYVMSSSHLQEMSDPSVQLRLHIKNPDDGSTNPVSFTVDSDKFRILLNELKQAQGLLENFGSS